MGSIVCHKGLYGIHSVSQGAEWVCAVYVCSASACVQCMGVYSVSRGGCMGVYSVCVQCMGVYSVSEGGAWGCVV